MVDRFDLEQQILDCWRITDEIPMMESQGANAADMTSLACVYEFKFKKLWATFEQMVAERQFKSDTDESKSWVCSKCGADRTKESCPNGYQAALSGECPMNGVAH